MFHVHRAERSDGLVAALGRVISAPLADALEAEVVAVPTARSFRSLRLCHPNTDSKKGGTPIS